MTTTMMTVISDHLRADVTPQYLAYAPVSASIGNVLLVAAGFANATTNMKVTSHRPVLANASTGRRSRSSRKSETR